MKPAGHRILVKPEQVKDEIKSEGGIVIPTLDKRAEQQAVVKGVVVAIGSTAWKDPSLGGDPWAQVGDTVLYAKFAGKAYEHPDTKEEFLFLNDEDIVAVL